MVIQNVAVEVTLWERTECGQGLWAMPITSSATCLNAFQCYGSALLRAP